MGQGYYPQHGADGDQPEDARDEGYPRQAALSGGVHQQGDQRLAGPEHKDDEQHPGGEAGRAAGFLVNVGMFAGVAVLVDVHITLGVDMQVSMGPFPVGPPQAPDHVRQPEADQPPSGDLTPHGLDIHQLAHRDTRADANESQHYRTQHVPDTAKHGDGQCPEQ